MLISPEKNQRNQRVALIWSISLALLVLVLGCWNPLMFAGLGLCPFCYWINRQRCLRRLHVADQPWPSAWEQILDTHVAFFRALNNSDQERFRCMVKVFLDEVQITGVRCEIDDTVRVLVAASAAIPIFGFQDWEYHRLGEVLIYPDKFGPSFQTRGGKDENILGMIGMKHLSGVMLLSKPALLEGFDNSLNSENVGIHEFVHLVENEEISHGLPLEVPLQSVNHWVHYVAREMASPTRNLEAINHYAYTNEHEFLAVLSEYFFKSPELLRARDPQLYAIMRDMFHQDTATLLGSLSRRRNRVNRNGPCLCGSEKRFRDCCLVESGFGNQSIDYSNNSQSDQDPLGSKDSFQPQ